MLTPLLFWLLAHLPPVPPPVTDLQMFPPGAYLEECLARYELHLEWARGELEQAATPERRAAYGDYLAWAEEQAKPWRLLSNAWNWSETTDDVWVGRQGVWLIAKHAAREELKELRRQIGPRCYYGGCLPPLPQWPRLPAESVPLPDDD